jgi:hypothetical protein
MSTELGILGTLLGLGVLAGVFFLLQRLRVRQRTLVVETTQFWRQATEETRARVLVQRFRHPWVYALLLGAASLLWLAFAGLDSRASERRESLVLIDGSAAMARGDRFETALERVDELLAALSNRSRTVILCDGQPRTLLKPGEHAQLFRDRLGDARPTASPATLRSVIRTHLARTRTVPLDIYVAGDSRLDESFLSALPEDVVVRRLGPLAVDAAARSVITALGFEDAASGRFDCVDVLVEVRAGAGQTIATPRLLLEGKLLGVEPVASKLGEPGSGERVQRVQFVYRDVPAQGQMLRASIAALETGASSDSGDAMGEDALGKIAHLVLPERKPIRVAIETGLPNSLTQAIAADPALQPGAEAAELVVRRAGSSFGGALPALELSDAASENAFFVTCGPGEDASEVILRLHERLGLGEIDAMGLARETRRVISIGGAVGDRRKLAIWESLLSEDYNFVSSRGFPLFVSLGLRWLSGRSELPQTLPAGAPTQLEALTVRSGDSRVLDPLGDAFVPAVAGELATEEAGPLAVALLDPSLTRASAAGDSLPQAELPGSGFDWITWLLLGALILLLVDWALFQRGRIP